MEEPKSLREDVQDVMANIRKRTAVKGESEETGVAETQPVYISKTPVIKAETNTSESSDELITADYVPVPIVASDNPASKPKPAETVKSPAYKASAPKDAVEPAENVCVPKDASDVLVTSAKPADKVPAPKKPTGKGKSSVS